jgi:hypothetical protein
MTSVPPKFGRLVFLAYPAVGLALGLADPWLGQLARQAGIRPGVATAVSVNLLLPLAAVGLALARPRVAAALLGAVALTAGFVAGLAIQYPPAVRGGSVLDVLESVPPVLVVAGVGYAVLGAVTALLVRLWRRAGAAGRTP